MSPAAFRNPRGGLIDRHRPIGFTFNGRSCQGFAGDTLASALLAHGVRIIGRSFKYHRPRGLFGLGPEEPNALVELGRGARSEPNSKATEIELFEGLAAASQNCWPSVGCDLGAVLGLVAPMIPAGFYYKTFMWPRRWWMLYERPIRRIAGMGRAPLLPDPDRYEHHHRHCDVLVVGAGPAGLAAAVAAGRSGARTILADAGSRPGGSLLGTGETVAGLPADGWIARESEMFRAFPDSLLLTRTTVFGYYDHNQLAAIERVADHRPALPGEPRQRLWHIQARQVVLATGAHERPLVFGNNDLPGIMLVSAARGYLNRYAVRAGQQAVVVTNNDSAYRAALDLAAGGIRVRALIDTRPAGDEALAKRLRDAGIAHRPGASVAHAIGRRGVHGVAVCDLDGGPGRSATKMEKIPCDLLCVSGGWTPAVHLYAQSRGRPVYDPGIAAYVPGPPVQAERSAGAARGRSGLVECVRDGEAAGAAAAAAAGFDAGTAAAEMPAAERAAFGPAGEAAGPIRAGRPAQSGIRSGRGSRKRFVDLQNDVTDKDITLAVREGYRSVEHVKRYTTLGMGTDQGKTSNALGFAHVADALEADIAAVGTTTYRPPYIPVALGALAGMRAGSHFMPARRTPMHEWHLAAGAIMAHAGGWLRPQCYPRAGESGERATQREALAVRRGVGLCDVSTLGKLELIGPDAPLFLEQIYINRWRTLRVGRCRYGVMLREDGIVFDDGTTTRLAEDRYFMTTTTVQAQAVARRLEYCRAVFWPGLRIRIVPVADQWATIALAGPASRAVLAAVSEGIDPGLPPMAAESGRIAGVAVRVHAISFSEEPAYEIYVPAGFGARVWERLIAGGAGPGITPYGIGALNVLRIEKGRVAAAEINGRTTAEDLGLGHMMKAEADFIGRRSLRRPGLADPARWQLVGLMAAERSSAIPGGAKIIDETRIGGSSDPCCIGEVTSAAWSPLLDRSIALGLVSAGRSRHGRTLRATSPLTGQDVRVLVCAPDFIASERAEARA